MSALAAANRHLQRRVEMADASIAEIQVCREVCASCVLRWLSNWLHLHLMTLTTVVSGSH